MPASPQFPVLDTDPHFRRVVSYMRPSDHLVWAGAAGAFPGAIYAMEMFDPTRPARGSRSVLRLATLLGVGGGFLLAYQRSSFRLWGFTENAPEAARAEEEGASAAGLDPSKSGLDPYLRGVAHRNSAWSQLKFSVLPWFNVVNHEHHGEAAAKVMAEAKQGGDNE